MKPSNAFMVTISHVFQTIITGLFIGNLYGQGLFPKNIPITESFNKLPVSGGICKGVMFGDADSLIDTSQLSVLIPSGVWKELKIEVISQDGMYNAELLYDISHCGMGMRKLKFPTKLCDKINRYTVFQMALYACVMNGQTTEIVPAGWQLKKNIDSISILINVGKNEDAKLKVDFSGMIVLPAALQGSTFSYNRIFTFPLAGNRKNVSVTLLRKKGFTSFHPIKLNIFSQ